MPYNCFTDDGNAAAILATNLETGDVIGVCGDHVMTYALGLLQSVTDTEWQPIGGFPTDPESGDVSDDDETGDGPTIPAPPGVEPAAPEAPGGPDDGDDQGEYGDQLAEDIDARNAELRAELRAVPSP